MEQDQTSEKPWAAATMAAEQASAAASPPPPTDGAHRRATAKHGLDGGEKGHDGDQRLADTAGAGAPKQRRLNGMEEPAGSRESDTGRCEPAREPEEAPFVAAARSAMQAELEYAERRVARLAEALRLAEEAVGVARQGKTFVRRARALLCGEKRAASDVGGNHSAEVAAALTLQVNLFALVEVPRCIARRLSAEEEPELEALFPRVEGSGERGAGIAPVECARRYVWALTRTDDSVRVRLDALFAQVRRAVERLRAAAPTVVSAPSKAAAAPVEADAQSGDADESRMPRLVIRPPPTPPASPSSLRTRSSAPDNTRRTRARARQEAMEIEEEEEEEDEEEEGEDEEEDDEGAEASPPPPPPPFMSLDAPLITDRACVCMYVDTDTDALDLLTPTRTNDPLDHLEQTLRASHMERNGVFDALVRGEWSAQGPKKIHDRFGRGLFEEARVNDSGWIGRIGEVKRRARARVRVLHWMMRVLHDAGVPFKSLPTTSREAKRWSLSNEQADVMLEEIARLCGKRIAGSCGWLILLKALEGVRGERVLDELEDIAADESAPVREITTRLRVSFRTLQRGDVPAWMLSAGGLAQRTAGAPQGSGSGSGGSTEPSSAQPPSSPSAKRASAPDKGGAAVGAKQSSPSPSPPSASWSASASLPTGPKQLRDAAQPAAPVSVPQQPPSNIQPIVLGPVVVSDRVTLNKYIDLASDGLNLLEYNSDERLVLNAVGRLEYSLRFAHTDPDGLFDVARRAGALEACQPRRIWELYGTGEYDEARENDSAWVSRMGRVKRRSYARLRALHWMMKVLEDAGQPITELPTTAKEGRHTRLNNSQRALLEDTLLSVFDIHTQMDWTKMVDIMEKSGHLPEMHEIAEGPGDPGSALRVLSERLYEAFSGAHHRCEVPRWMGKVEVRGTALPPSLQSAKRRIKRAGNGGESDDGGNGDDESSDRDDDAEGDDNAEGDDASADRGVVFSLPAIPPPSTEALQPFVTERPTLDQFHDLDDEGLHVLEDTRGSTLLERLEQNVRYAHLQRGGMFGLLQRGETARDARKLHATFGGAEYADARAADNKWLHRMGRVRRNATLRVRLLHWQVRVLERAGVSLPLLPMTTEEGRLWATGGGGFSEMQQAAMEAAYGEAGVLDRELSVEKAVEELERQRQLGDMEDIVEEGCRSAAELVAAAQAGGRTERFHGVVEIVRRLRWAFEGTYRWQRPKWLGGLGGPGPGRRTMARDGAEDAVENRLMSAGGVSGYGLGTAPAATSALSSSGAAAQLGPPTLVRGRDVSAEGVGMPGAGSAAPRSCSVAELIASAHPHEGGLFHALYCGEVGAQPVALHEHYGIGEYERALENDREYVARMTRVRDVARNRVRVLHFVLSRLAENASAAGDEKQGVGEAAAVVAMRLPRSANDRVLPPVPRTLLRQMAAMIGGGDGAEAGASGGEESAAAEVDVDVFAERCDAAAAATASAEVATASGSDAGEDAATESGDDDDDKEEDGDNALASMQRIVRGAAGGGGKGAVELAERLRLVLQQLYAWQQPEWSPREWRAGRAAELQPLYVPGKVTRGGTIYASAGSGAMALQRRLSFSASPTPTPVANGNGDDGGGDGGDGGGGGGGHVDVGEVAAPAAAAARGAVAGHRADHAPYGGGYASDAGATTDESDDE